jgi:hypothetical protein
MKPLASRFLLVLLLLVVAARGSESLQDARRAQALLGAEVWSQVIRVENTGWSRRYPRRVEALVFELAGILWFYTDADGTQSLSTQRGRLAQDKADLTPLLREIDHGFTAWSPVPDDERARAEVRAARGPLRNGCFIESVAALRERLAAGESPGDPQLLSYYIAGAGHTVLTYQAGDGVRVIDPAEPDRVQTFPRALAGRAGALAAALTGGGVTKAVWLRLADFAGLGTARFAAGLLRSEAPPARHVES